jgi:acyl carrier protein
MSPSDRTKTVVEFVTREAAAVLGIDPSEPVPLDLGFFEMGMDSLMSVELRRRLERAVGRKLPSTLTFNYPDVRRLAAYLDGLVAPPQAKPAAPAPTVVVEPETKLSDVDHDAMSEDEIAAMLSDALQSID